MSTNSSSTGFVIGLASAGLALAIAGVRLYWRKKNQGKAGPPADVIEDEAGAGKEQPGQGAVLSTNHEIPPKPQANLSPERLPLDYFALVFALSVPFWLIGDKKLPLPMELPASALGFANPVIAASILTYRRKGWDGVMALFRKAFQAPRHKVWLLPILFLLPTIFLLSYVIMRVAGMPLPDPNIPVLMAPTFFILFFIPAMGEELGWMGYAIEPMRNRWGIRKAALFLGIIWALWHIIPDIQNHKTAIWILWHRLYSVALRVLIVWIYTNTDQSVLAATLLHTMDNVTVFLFPNYGSHYNPLVTAVLTWLAAGVVILKETRSGNSLWKPSKGGLTLRPAPVAEVLI